MEFNALFIFMEFSISEFRQISDLNKHRLLDIGYETYGDTQAIVPAEFWEHAPTELLLREKQGVGDLAETELTSVAPKLVPSIVSIALRNITNETFEHEDALKLLRQAIRHELFHVAFHSVVTPLAKTITEGIVARFEEEYRTRAGEDGGYYYEEISGHSSTTGFLVDDNEICDFSPKVKHILYECVQRELSCFGKDEILDCLLNTSILTWDTGVYPSIKRVREEFAKILGPIADESFLFRPIATGRHCQLSFMRDCININSFNVELGQDNTRYGGLKRYNVDTGDRLCLAFEFMEKLKKNGKDLNYAGGILQFWPPVRAKYVDLLKLTGLPDESIRDTMNTAYRVSFEVYPNQEEYYAGAEKILATSVPLPKTDQ